ncbi:hypothetical protein H8356DRAFT_1335457 [Neocallimastix lanati (nom. inval.)]|nr:hypothetical protein H8356DRAFT_1335457 [Neocallimastix sp. JGI-2020a]
MVFACKELENYRNKSLVLLDDLFLKFAMIVEQKSLNVSLDSEKDYDNNIYYFILINDREQRQLVNNIFKQSSTSSTDPYFSVDVEMIRHYSFDNTNTEIITHNNGRGVIIDEWENDSENNSIISNNVVNRSISFNRNQIISSDYSKTPFLVRFAALFTEIMSRASYKRKLTRSINAENEVRKASRANASEGEDHIFFQIDNSNLNP